MHVLAENGGNTYGAVTIDAAHAFVPPFAGSPFACLVWDHEGRFADAGRFAVAEALLAAGCRYAVCGGERCEAWHDAVDEVWLAQHFDDADDAQHASQIMTTWHDGESADAVARFFVRDTGFEDHGFRRYLVLHIGSGPARALLDTAVQRYARRDDAV